MKVVTGVRVVTFKLDEELLGKLDLYAMNNRLFRSEVIREAIKFYLSNYKNNEADMKQGEGEEVEEE